MDLEGIGNNAAWKFLQPQTGCTCADHYSTFPNILQHCVLRFHLKILTKTVLKNNQATKIILCFSLRTSADTVFHTVPLESGTKR